jgi:hypothetical protein
MSKDLIIDAVKSMDEPVDIEEFLEKVKILELLAIADEQSRNGIVISDEEMDHRIDSWLK